MKTLILRYLEIIGNNVFFKIEEQSHREYEFGNTELGDTFIASNGIKFISMSYPDLYFYEDNEIVFCCHGSNETEDDRRLSAPLVLWGKVKIAVKEYNEFYGYHDNCILGEIIRDIVPREMFIID